jgi:lantibiotic modifying enzyme
MDFEKLLSFNLQNYKTLSNKSIKLNNIYAGKAGYIIYLLELYDITKDQSVLIEAEEVAELITHQIDPSDIDKMSYAFYTGLSGIALSFIFLYRVTKKKQYLEFARLLLFKSKESFNYKIPIVELINGISGIILVLLNLYIELREDWIPSDIEFYAKFIIDKARLGQNGGIYWDKSYRITRGLTGFSHGASGIGFVFYELYRATGDPVLKDICYESFKYEDSNFDYEANNWLDYRKYFYNPDTENEFKEAIASNNQDYFLKPSSMKAWCHGSPGILMTRFHSAYQNKYSEYLMRDAFISLIQVSNHTLCHGALGNMLCILSIERVDKNEIKTIFSSVVEKTLQYYKLNKKFTFNNPEEKLENNYGLFTGNLGVLYFLLKAYKFYHSESIGFNILFPKLDLNNTIVSFKIGGYRNKAMTQILKSSYAKTLHFLSDTEIYQIDETAFKEKVHSSNNQIAIDAYKFEEAHRAAEREVSSFSMEYHVSLFLIEKLSNINVNEFNKILVKINPAIVVVNTVCDWNSKSNPLWTNNSIPNFKSNFEYIFVPNYHVVAIEKDEIITMILNKVQNTNLLVSELFNIIESQIDGDTNKVRPYLFNRFKMLIINKILVIADGI